MPPEFIFDPREPTAVLFEPFLAVGEPAADLDDVADHPLAERALIDPLTSKGDALLLLHQGVQIGRLSFEPLHLIGHLCGLGALLIGLIEGPRKHMDAGQDVLDVFGAPLHDRPGLGEGAGI
jgi:hypothetical protein